VLRVNGEGRSDTGAQSDTSGAPGSTDASTADFAENIGCCVIEKAEAIGSESEALDESAAEVTAIEISELVLHEAGAR
jgi:hypothetical protein